MAHVEAIAPHEVASTLKASMPDAVLESFNALIAENFNGRSATVYQKDVVSRLESLGHSRSKIFDKGWLNVEDIYRAQGWKVTYDKPGYCESYDANFSFSKK